MLCRNIIEAIRERYPERYALSWDNVGLLVGRNQTEVDCIYIALDATDEVIGEAVSAGAQMLVTHHPLIFSGIKQINDEDFIGRRILALAEHKIAYYAMHTNYDVCGMSGLSGELLNLTDPEVLEITAQEEPPAGIGKIAPLAREMTLRECCELVKRTFGLDAVRVFGDLDQTVRVAAVCPGSGKSVIGEAIRKKADVLITGDIGHHEGIDSVAQGLAVIDAGHYGIEHIFVEDLRRYLEERLTGVRIVTAPVRHPFRTV